MSARGHPGLAKRERILADVEDADGKRVVATDRALLLQPGTAWVRLGWEQIERADWDDHTGRLRLVGLTPDLPSIILHLGPNSPLVTLARERIGWTRLISTTVELAGLGKARVTVRREPANGALVWVVRLHPQVDPADPRLETVTDAALRSLRAQLGIGH